MPCLPELRFETGIGSIQHHTLDPIASVVVAVFIADVPQAGPAGMASSEELITELLESPTNTERKRNQISR
jgi:hypothetical protein